MKSKEIRSFSQKEIQEKILKIKTELLGLKLSLKNVKESNPAKYSKLKKNIARLNTIMVEKINC